jgi:glyoxylase I family protein
VALDALDVPHSGVQEERGGPLIVLRDPDNIQLELWAFDLQAFVQRHAR